MLSHISHWLRLDRIRDPLLHFQLRVLYLLETVILVVILVIWVSSTVTGEDNRVEVLASLLVVGFLFVITLRTTNAHKLWVFPAIGLILVCFLALSNQGLVDVAILIFPLLITLAGLLSARRGVIIAGVMTTVASVFVGLAHLNGWFSLQPNPAMSPVRIVQTFVFLAINAVLTYFLIDYMLQAIVRFRHVQEALQQRNLELELLQQSLETQVAERTQSAEAAKAQAEEIAAQLQAQAWLAIGQSELVQSVRSLQGSRMMAARAIRQMVRYINGSGGAIYLREDDHLALAAGFALRPDPETPEHIRFGEGLIGQAALDKKTIFLKEIPGEMLQVASGLGSASPGEVVIFPFLYEDEVQGVLVLATFSPFNDRQKNMLEIYADQLGISFHAVLRSETLSN